MTVDRREAKRREEKKESTTRKFSPEPKLENGERRKKQRRRHIDPTTCERDYSQDEIEFMKAMDDYKRAAGRMFPTCSEVLEVVRSMGYVRLSDEQVSILQSYEFGGNPLAEMEEQHSANESSMDNDQMDAADDADHDGV
ncbi:MAG: hypothetical protein AAFP69_04065 [Planctomycetota bacterium]